MFWLFRRFCTLVGFLVICGITLFFARNVLVNWACCWALNHATTFGCQIDQVYVEPNWPTRIHIRSMTIKNPTDFPQPVALEIPDATLELASDVWENNQLTFRSVSVEINRFDLVNTEPGGNNLARFNTVAQRERNQSSFFNFQILQLHITDPRFFGTRRYKLVDSLPKVARILSEIAHARAEPVEQP